jgi:hypothetical protein
MGKTCVSQAQGSQQYRDVSPHPHPPPTPKHQHRHHYLVQVQANLLQSGDHCKPTTRQHPRHTIYLHSHHHAQ